MGPFSVKIDHYISLTNSYSLTTKAVRFQFGQVVSTGRVFKVCIAAWKPWKVHLHSGVLGPDSLVILDYRSS